jgi:hypothetical protein
MMLNNTGHQKVAIRSLTTKQFVRILTVRVAVLNRAKLTLVNLQ